MLMDFLLMALFGTWSLGHMGEKTLDEEDQREYLDFCRTLYPWDVFWL